MLRIYFMQCWPHLSDPDSEDSRYDSESMRRFSRIELMEYTIPGKSTILRFRRLLEQYKLTVQLSALLSGLLDQRHPLRKSATTMDPMVIEAPPSTKNEARARDNDMRQTKKGKDCQFGMKAHIGTDRNGRAHSLLTTNVAQPDVSKLHQLLPRLEREAYGNQAQWGQMHRHSAVRARCDHAFHVVKNF